MFARVFVMLVMFVNVHLYKDLKFSLVQGGKPTDNRAAIQLWNSN